MPGHKLFTKDSWMDQYKELQQFENEHSLATVMVDLNSSLFEWVRYQSWIQWKKHEDDPTQSTLLTLQTSHLVGRYWFGIGFAVVEMANKN
jgi:hypothetical protein